MTYDGAVERLHQRRQMVFMLDTDKAKEVIRRERITQSRLAEMTGVSREHVGRLLKKGGTVVVTRLVGMSMADVLGPEVCWEEARRRT